jgi:hypothetical protein
MLSPPVSCQPLQLFIAPQLARPRFVAGVLVQLFRPALGQFLVCFVGPFVCLGLRVALRTQVLYFAAGGPLFSLGSGAFSGPRRLVSTGWRVWTLWRCAA